MFQVNHQIQLMVGMPENATHLDVASLIIVLKAMSLSGNQNAFVKLPAIGHPKSYQHVSVSKTFWSEKE